MHQLWPLVTCQQLFILSIATYELRDKSHAGTQVFLQTNNVKAQLDGIMPDDSEA